jgi:cytosine/adenosine deaminase-related metal-dependent hydrolase
LGAEPVDLLVDGECIVQVGADLHTDALDAEVIDAHNRLILPGFVDAHAHLDKNLLGLPWYHRVPGRTLLEQTANERQVRLDRNIDFRVQASRQVRMSIAGGTTRMRSFVDIDTDGQLRGFDGIMLAREDFCDSVVMQVVAFPQSGMLVRPGTRELVETALANGANVVGSIDPCLIERDPVEHLNVVFGLAEKYDADVDVHLHELGELGAFSLELIAERVRVLGWQGRVAISHAFCLGDIAPAHLTRLVELLCEQQIAITTTGPAGSVPIPSVEGLRKAGVVVCTGSDGVRDTWAPLNMPDMLLRTYVLAHRNGLSADSELELALDVATFGGARVTHATDYGLAAGCSADFVIVDGETHAEIVIERPPRWLVVSRGRIVAREGECLV